MADGEEVWATVGWGGGNREQSGGQKWGGGSTVGVSSTSKNRPSHHKYN